MTYPSCFDSMDEYRAWVAASHKVLGVVTARTTNLANYCKDCTPAFAERMRREQRCDHPDVRFVTLPEEGLTGVLNGQSNGVVNSPDADARLSSVRNRKKSLVQGDQVQARPVRFLRSFVFAQERDSSSADDECEQCECAGPQDNGQ